MENRYLRRNRSKRTKRAMITRVGFGHWSMSISPMLSSKTKRINITVPARVLAILDEAAAREGETRSGLLARAALSYVERQSTE